MRIGKGMGGALAAIAVVLVLGYGLLSGQLSPEQVIGELLGDAPQQASGPTTAKGAPPPPPVEEVRGMHGELEVEPAGSMAGYSREEFPHWASDGTEFGWEEPDGSCDVRDDALFRDGKNVRVDEDCSFTSGSWLDPYTGAVLRDTEEVDIDHIVPLANAWRSGAASWSEADREQYANDPKALLSADDAANQEKGDKGPDAWKPPNQDFHCEYARRWIDVKHEWSLSVNEQEKSALSGMLDSCPSGG